MTKKSRFWGPFGKQYGNWDQTVLKCEWHHFYHVYWSLSRQLSSNKSLLVICKISGLFFNTLTAGQKYSFLNRDNLPQPIQTQLSLKRKTFSQLFFCIFEMQKNFFKFLKKRWPSKLMYFRNYGPRKPWLDKCLKSPVSEGSSKSNILNRLQRCVNVNHSTFSILIDQCEGNWIGKSLS